MSSSSKECLELAFLPSAATIIDVGCNINSTELDDFTGLALFYFPRARILGVEPLHYQAYEEKWGNDQRVRLVKKALAQDEKTRFMYTPEAHGLSTFYDRDVFKTWNVEDQPKTVEVECTTIDILGKEMNLPRINYLKIDAEGAEYSILKGAEDYLSRVAIDYIQFEHGVTFQDAGYTFQDVADFLGKFTYRELAHSETESLWVRS